MLSTCRGVRLKAMPLASVGTMFDGAVAVLPVMP